MKPSVLIVDDSLTVRMDLNEAFEAAGFATTLCDTLAASREALGRGKFAVVILDVLLPDGDGLEFLKEVKATALAAPPVLLLSSESEVRDRIRGLKTGADEYVGKPYDTSYVVARARELIRRTRPAMARGSATVLVIDDSATFRDLLRDAFQAAGYSVVAAENGEEGLRLAVASAPDVVVVDGMLPGISGPTVIRRLRSDVALQRIPCLLLTASSSDDRADELLALEAGADAYVRKAEDTALILARVTALLRPGRTPAPFVFPSSLLGPKRLLAVDDSATYLQALASQLRDDGYDVALAPSGEEALDLLTVQPVDAILLDLVMPGLSGQETCRRIKSSPAWRDTPVLILTAHDERSAMLEGINAGADDYIAKSSDFEVLKARLRAQIRRKQFEDDNRRIREELLRRETEAIEARAERAVAEARAAQQAEIGSFFAVSRDLLCVAGFDGYLKSLNPAWTQVLGFTEEEVLAEPFLNLAHPDDRQATRASFQRVLSGHEVTQFENRCRCKDGTYRWILWSASPDMNRKIVYAAGRDLTDRHRMEEALREQTVELRAQGEELKAQQAELETQNVELERASKLKSEFLANMSHELRTPLNAVIGFSELLLDEAGKTLAAHQLKYVDDILASGRHLLHLINDILDLVKIEAGRITLSLEPVDPAEAFFDARGLVAPAARKKGISIETSSTASRPVLADRAKLRQILLNLLSNAVKFVPEGSSVELGAEDQGQFVRFWVRDEGPGMDEELLGRLFKPFVQGESPLVKKHAGTGLGLAISKGLVEAHGGAIQVTSRVGVGTTFSFTLVAAPGAVACAEPFRSVPGPEARPAAPSAPALPREAKEESPPPRARLVVAIDDDPKVGALLRPTLEAAGYEVATALTGREGIELARARRPDLAIVDLVLPDTSGFDVVEALAGDPRTRDTRIIILTARDLTDPERERLKRHVYALANKGDLTRDALLAAMDAAMAARPASLQPGPTILVVDDHDMNRELARTILERRGYRVIVAPDGNLGVEAARRERPALVLMDLAMPGKDGFAAVRELKADPATAEIPIVALTAFAMRSDEQRVRDAGFDGYLTKPIDRVVLENAVASFLSGPSS